MLSHRSRMLHQHHKPQRVKAIVLSQSSNPEEMATTNLLKISNQEFDPTDYELFSSAPLEQNPPKNKSTHLPPKAEPMRKINSCGNYQSKKPRVSVVEHFTECFEISRRKSSFQLSLEQQKENGPKNVLNTSSFLVLSQENYKNIKVYESKSTEHCSQEKIQYRNKKPKNVSSLLRKRNKSLFKQYLQLHKQCREPTSILAKRASSPANFRANISTNLPLVEEPSSPIRITSPTKIEEDHKKQFRCVNVNFGRVGARNLRYHSKQKIFQSKG